MNRTIISIEVQDHGGTEAAIIVRGERNNQIMFEEQFEYKDEESILFDCTYFQKGFIVSFPN